MTSDTDPTIKRRRGRPRQINREDIINAVLSGGAEPTLVDIAKKLQVTPQALYHHVQGHTEVIEMVFSAVVNRVPLPSSEGLDWPEYAIAMGFYLRDIYDAVPGLAEYAISTLWQETVLYERREKILQIARAGGYATLPAFWATRALSEFVHGWVSREHRLAMSRGAGARSERELFNRAAQASDIPMPLSAEAYELEKNRRDERFDFTLRALVAGLAMQMRVMAEEDG
jgi:AcrR family transcriptional regulator